MSIDFVLKRYGTTWISDFDEAQVKCVLKIHAAKKVPICITFGMPTGKHVARGVKTRETIIYLDQFGKRSTTRGE